MGRSSVYRVVVTDDYAEDIAASTAEAILETGHTENGNVEILALYTDYNATELQGEYGVQSVRKATEVPDTDENQKAALGIIAIALGAAWWVTK